MRKEEIYSEEKLGKKHGNFSQGIKFGNLVFTVQVGNLPDGSLVGPGAYEQTVQAIRNAEIVLNEVGGTLDNVLKVMIYMLDLEHDFADMNRAYKELMPSNPFPSRATVQVCEMVDEGVKVEMEFTAGL